MTHDNNDINWVIAPVSQAVLYVGEEMKISGTLVRSLANLKAHGTLLKVARENLLRSKQIAAIQSLDRLLVEAPGLSQAAAELLANDYAIINTHSLISMWSAVEVAVEDTVILVLTKNPGALTLLANAGVKTTQFEPGPVLNEDARKLFRRVERQLREGRNIGEFYVKILDILGIKFSCSSNLLIKMEEINNVRNCLMHRGGVIDARAAQSVAALLPFRDKKIPITQVRYMEYFDAISGFLIAFLNGAVACGYTKPRSF